MTPHRTSEQLAEPALQCDVYLLVHPVADPADLDPAVIHRAFRTEDAEPVWDDPDDTGLADEATYGQHPRHGDLTGLLDGFDARLANLTGAHAATTARRILIDDGGLALRGGGWTPGRGRVPGTQVLPGVPAADWEVLPAAREQLADRIPGLLPAGTRVLLAGFSRYDCLAIVADLLTADGCLVTLDDPVSLPLSESALDVWMAQEELRA